MVIQSARKSNNLNLIIIIPILIVIIQFNFCFVPHRLFNLYRMRHIILSFFVLSDRFAPQHPFDVISLPTMY